MKMSLTAAIQHFSGSHPELWDGPSARGKDLETCIEFMKLLTDNQEEMATMLQSGPRSYRGGEIEEHYWVNINGKNVDWTIRQYSEAMRVPTVWEYPFR